MDAVLARLLGFVLKAVLLVAGLVVFLSLLTAALLLGCLWLVRAAWARLTGRPVTPWVMHMRPQDSWNRFYRTQSARSEPSSSDSVPSRRDSSDVTDVEIKVPRP